MIEFFQKGIAPNEFRGCFLAGGAVLSYFKNSPINDYDLYPKSKEDFINTINYLADDIGGEFVSITNRAVTFRSFETNESDERTLYQIMLVGFHTDVKNIFELFDFRVCMGAYDFDTGNVILDDNYFKDIHENQLVFNHKTLYPLASLLRMTKYTKGKGFNISRREMTKLSLAITKKDFPKSWDEVSEILGSYYGKQIEVTKSEPLNFNCKSNSKSCETEFSEEAVFDILSSDLPDDYNLPDDKTYTVDEVIENTVGYEGEYYKVSEEECVFIRSSDGKMKLKKTVEIGDAVEILETDYFSTFKWFGVDENDQLVPVTWNSPIVYTVGDYINEPTGHGFYVGKDMKCISSYGNASFYGKMKKKRLFEVYIRPSDIKSIERNTNVLIVKGMKIIKEIPKEDPSHKN